MKCSLPIDRAGQLVQLKSIRNRMHPQRIHYPAFADRIVATRPHETQRFAPTTIDTTGARGSLICSHKR
jgi:hypothetical protein